MTENELRRLILKRPDLSAGAKIALLGVMLRIDWETWSGECSVTEVMNLTALSRSGVNRAFVALKDAGIIERSHTQRGPRADRAKMRVNIEALQDPVHNVNSSQKDKLTIHKKNSSQKTPIHKVDTNGTQKNKLTVHNMDTNRTHYGENQPSSTIINNNQPTRAALPVEEKQVLRGSYKPDRYMPPDLHDEKKKRMKTLNEAFRRCGIEQEYKIRWIHWWHSWRVENYPLWHHMNWDKFDLDVVPAIAEIKREQEESKKMRHPNQW